MAITSFFNTAQSHATTFYTRRIYNARPSDVTPLSARTFGTWTLLSGLVRLYTAYNIRNAVLYDLGMCTFAIAWLHFVLEWTMWGTIRSGRGLWEPFFISTVTIVWMWSARADYVGGWI